MKKQISYFVRRAFYRLGLVLQRVPFGFRQPELYESERGVYVNLGAGEFSHPCWLNVDYPNTYYSPLQSKIDVPLNFVDFEKMPFEDCSVDLVYCSHVIEHLSDETVERVVQEIYRMLRDKGMVRIVCPDIDLAINALRQGDEAFFGDKSPWSTPVSKIEDKFIEFFATGMSPYIGEPDRLVGADLIQQIVDGHDVEGVLDSITCELSLEEDFFEGHRNWFNHKKLRDILSDAGFKTVLRSGYLQSRSSLMRDSFLFDSTMPQVSMFIEAIK